MPAAVPAPAAATIATPAAVDRAAAAQPPRPALPSAAQVLLDRLHELGRKPGRLVLIAVPLARIPPLRRKAYHQRVAKALMQDLAGTCQGQVFTLGAGDLALLGGTPPAVEIERLAATLRRLFALGSESPTASDAGPPTSPALWPLSLWSLAEQQAEAESYIAAQPEPAAEPLPVVAAPAGPALIRTATAALDALDTARLAQLQPCVLLAAGRPPRLMFREVALSLPAIEARLPPGSLLRDDPFLFRHFAAELDRRLLELLGRWLAAGHVAAPDPATPEPPLAAAPGPALGCVLSLSTVLSPAFAAFDAALPAEPRPRLFIGIAATEAYADLAAFAEARRRLQALGHAVVLDGASETLLALTEPATLGTDLIKLTAPALPPDTDPGPIAAAATPEALRRADPERVVLAQIETPAQLAWGARLGIARFQGRQIDLLLAERRLRRCAAATACACDAALCAAAAAAIDAAGRARCGKPALLDAALETGQ